MRAVLDTNVLVSAVLTPGSTPDRAVAVVLVRGVVLLSADTVAEADKVLARPRLDRFRPAADRRAFLANLLARGQVVPIATPVAACRDPDDDKFLEVAVNGRADYLVSGDQDLLVLRPFRGVPILSPADFLAAVAPPAAGGPAP